MDRLDSDILEQLIAGFAEPLLVARVDSTDWPIVLGNKAFENVTRLSDVAGKPFADIIERVVGRELAVEVSEAVRASHETTIPVEIRGLEFALVLVPQRGGSGLPASYFAAYWRAAGAGTGNELHRALLRANRRIRDLSRDDPVTGFLNEAAFREVLAHDWAVAARERSSLALVCFTLNEFSAYRDVFGRHASDACMRRVGKAIKRFLRRASDVVARLGDDKLVVLSHSSGESGVREFAERIATAVQELGLHHPRARSGRYITVSYRVGLMTADSEHADADSLLDEISR